MKIAVLMLCHKNAGQINLFLNAMHHPDIAFYIHVDKKSPIAPEIMRREDVHLLPDPERVSVEWGGLSQIEATLHLAEEALSGEYDYYWLCSGQDFPIQPADKIVDYFRLNQGFDFIDLSDSKNFGKHQSNKYDKRVDLYYPGWIMGRENLKRIMKRLYVEATGGYNKTWGLKRKNSTGLDFYFGSQWWCLRHETLVWMKEYVASHAEYYSFFKNSTVPDECFFQTLYMNSPFKQARKEYLHYIDWSDGGNSPRMLQMEKIDEYQKSGKLMARKFDLEGDLR